MNTAPKNEKETCGAGRLPRRGEFVIFRSGVNWSPPVPSYRQLRRPRLRWPSAKSARPARLSTDACTKISLPPRSDPMKPNPFTALYHLTVPDSLDGGLIGRRIHPSLRSSASGRLLRRGAGVDTQNFGYLRPFGAGPGADLQCRARRHAAVAATLDHTCMQEGIAGSIGKLHEAETLVGVVPFDNSLGRGAGRCFKPLRAEFRRRSEIAPGRFVVVVGEGASPRRAKISVFVAHVSAWAG